ncbi:hypothetical protein ABPG75_005003 [Micractinium tetrahymenae]
MHLLAVTTSAAAGLARPAQCKAARQQSACQWTWAPALAPRRWQRATAVAAGAADPPAASQGESEGLLPEEDVEIPGSYRDAMTSNTPLGRAVKGACDELDSLGELERQTLEEAEGLLKKLGFKGSLFAAPLQEQQEAQQQGQQQQGAGSES